MSAELVNLNDHRPHLRVSGADGKEHVMPVALVERVVRGELPMIAIDPAVWRTIAREWLSGISR